jgi:hypothetical protein
LRATPAAVVVLLRGEGSSIAQTPTGNTRRKIFELLGREEDIALALDVVDAGPAGGKPNFSNDGRAVGREDESLGGVPEELPEDLRQAYGAILVEASCGREQVVNVHCEYSLRLFSFALAEEMR